jgi:hypothetical protein
LLSYIALTIFNKPFVFVLFGAVGVGGITGFGAYYGILSIYSVLVTQIVHQSYSLIFNLPDRVLRWLGQQVDSSAVSQAVQAGESETKEGASKTQGAMTMPQIQGGGGGGEGGGGEGGGAGGKAS